MFLCLQEPNGRMGDIVKRNLFEPKNVVIPCSSSGKLTSSLVKYWRDKFSYHLSGKKLYFYPTHGLVKMMRASLMIEKQLKKRFAAFKYRRKPHRIYNLLIHTLIVR